MILLMRPLLEDTSENVSLIIGYCFLE